MKKFPKIISILTLFLSIFIGFAGLINQDVAAATDTATVTLHKKKMTNLPDLYQNTGEEMDYFDQFDAYEMGAEFSVYDVTNRFYTERAAGKTVEQAFEAINNTPTGLTPIEVGTTDEDGLLNFTLNKKSGGRDAVYLFVESDNPGVITAENFLLSFPVYALDADGEYTNRELDTIHLYPKNVVDVDGRLLVTKRGSAENETLNGAKFIIQSARTDRYLAGATAGMFTWSDEIEDAYTFETGFSYSIGATGIAQTDSAVNHGELGILGFEAGDYRLIETAAPTGAEMINEETMNDFTITADQEVATRVNVLNDTILIDKDIVGVDRDYSLGAEIPYQIKVNIPEGMGDKLVGGAYRHPSMIIIDNPDLGLNFKAITQIKAGDTIIPLANVTMDTSGNGFTMTIPASQLEANAGKDLVITYTMFLNGEVDPDVAFSNLASVNTTRITDDDDGPEVFTGGKRFVKVDANFAENNTLAGARFVVRNADADNAKYLAYDENGLVIWVDDIDDAEPFVSDANGLVEVTGLAYADYWLEETAAPADYVLREDRLMFTVAAGSYMNDEVLAAAMKVTNVRKGRLPTTGGSGIMGIVGVGVLLVLTTGGYYYKRQQDA